MGYSIRTYRLTHCVQRYVQRGGCRCSNHHAIVSAACGMVLQDKELDPHSARQITYHESAAGSAKDAVGGNVMKQEPV